MEAQQFDKEKLLPYTVLINTDKLLETSEKIKDKTKEEIHCHFLKSSSSPSFMSHLTHSETSLELTTVITQVYTDEEPEENQIDGELLYTSDYKEMQSPSHLLPRPRLSEKSGRRQETAFLKHKLSASICSDLKPSVQENNSKFQTEELTNVETSSSDDQEDEDEDVFTELPVSGTILDCLHKMYISQAKEDRYCHTSNEEMISVIGGKDISERKLKALNMHLQFQPEMASECSDSLLCLMKKLGQLNLDIKEALSVGSSPSGMPYPKRWKQMVRMVHMPFTVHDAL